MSSNKKIIYKPYGDKAILIEWNAVIHQEILDDILEFKFKIEQQKKLNISDLIVGYNSLTIVLRHAYKDFYDVQKQLESIYKSVTKNLEKDRFLWEIPVCYDSEFGIDLEEIAALKKTTVDDIIKMHSNATYTVYFIGFLPGFLYLGGLNKKLFTHRKSNPRLQVAKGSVAIGGKQTGIYPADSPGGWHIIGKTPVSFFSPKALNPCFAKSGDQLKFKPISSDEYALLSIEVAEDLYKLRKTIIK